jgi:3-methyladenine DNA glycosylase AlkC
MAELLKLRYSKAHVEDVAAAIVALAPTFDARGFARAVLGDGWNELELKQRIARMSAKLKAFLPGSYREQLAVLRDVAPAFGGLEAMFFPDFVSAHGLDEFEPSVAALEHFTQFSSSEFAVRPFLVHYGDRMLAEFLRWTTHPSEHVRRLASEGARPRLPWAMALPQFKRDPKPLLPILEALRDDASAYVRRSVANHLNDIAKDHPDLVLEIAGRWLGTSAEAARLVRHACRTLLKRGDQRALKLFGHHDEVAVRVTRFVLGEKAIPIGSDLDFTFTLRADADTPARIEYAVDFVKSDGRTGRKVFQVGTRRLAAGKAVVFERTHRFRDFTTRKHHPGRHAIAVVVNGVERARKHVLLLPAKRSSRRR